MAVTLESSFGTWQNHTRIQYHQFFGPLYRRGVAVTGELYNHSAQGLDQPSIRNVATSINRLRAG